MCENLSPDRIRCEPCRTINLAKHIKQPKPDMQIYDKCSPTQKVECARVTELPLNPTCIRVCSKDEFKLKKSGKALAMPKMPLPYGHGRVMYAVKAGILVGAVYFTYTQGVWGDQQDVTECIRRWQEYIRSINTRRPPVFDQCGKVIGTGLLLKWEGLGLSPPRQPSADWQTSDAFENIMKNSQACRFPHDVSFTVIASVVKVPLLIKCAYFDYLEALRKKQEEEDRERKIRKRG